MTPTAALKSIREAIDRAPRNGYMAEFHLQVIKYADLLLDVSGKEFCEAIGVGPAFGTEFSKMRKIAARLKAADLNVDKI
jgi:hypothetical protein